jgi:hypothetical protein
MLGLRGLWAALAPFFRFFSSAKRSAVSWAALIRAPGWPGARRGLRVTIRYACRGRRRARPRPRSSYYLPRAGAHHPAGVIPKNYSTYESTHLPISMKECYGIERISPFDSFMLHQVVGENVAAGTRCAEEHSLLARRVCAGPGRSVYPARADAVQADTVWSQVAAWCAVQTGTPPATTRAYADHGALCAQPTTAGDARRFTISAPYRHLLTEAAMPPVGEARL